jgi:hypothetical protein
MIRIERVSLPPGLRAIAGRDPRGYLVIYVSNALDAKGQRAAVMEAVRATRRAGWRGVVPVWIALLAVGRLRLGRAMSAVRTQPAALLAGTAAIAAAGVLAAIILATAPPHQPGPAQAAAPPAGSTGVSPQPGAPGHHSGQVAPSHRGGQVQPVIAVPSSTLAGQPLPGATSPGSSRTPPAPGRTSSPTTPAPGSSSPEPSPAPSPAPAPSSSSPAPSPPPSSSSPSPSRSCLVVLGIRICARL